ncbi:uncharacterized protein LOC111262760 [Varroa jacobsoni]|uniref:Uncharacterized protein n=1 Tax=Varroa destructor TaxID=109461 RepID=A0A7M7L0G0_VARDE|nr:uncharacterized protein LOC111255545 [Varroa destructor]XP_022673356.1 uncharacterized protein LOC111255545 [Varroa destructor]XP_022673357.1 uncharacterized protein LOC111255545 [Varroa destructor]XP_022692998.1 uncharacterized protein LOC111262760 [Varroa jacobsoni]XP_022692999.1 uncharacterized protein LOC111262760 [Varroa jacobsoni]XP_022693000.1 uncharacterized protein LOC111262760 [Varroa jacobsoni]
MASPPPLPCSLPPCSPSPAQASLPQVNVPTTSTRPAAKNLFRRIPVPRFAVRLNRVQGSCTLQNAVLCIGILSIGLYVFEAVLFSTFILYNASTSSGSPQDTWALSVCIMQVLQGVVGAVLSGFLLRGALREERRFVLAWLVCAGLGIAFLFKACVIETLAITAQKAKEQGNAEALTKTAIKCLILFVEMFFFIVVHAFYVRLRQDQDPPPYDTIA